MITLSQAVIVEGRYDKIKLDAIVDSLIITTEGFSIFRDTEKCALIRRLAKEFGIVVLTDSDDAGFKIRKYISDIAASGRVYHAYIPEIPGRERRKQKAGCAGLLGVEGIDVAVIEQAIINSGVHQIDQKPLPCPITAADFMEDGLTGRPGAAVRRAQLLTLAGLPTRLSSSAARGLLGRLFGYEGYKTLVGRLKKIEMEIES